MSNIYYPLARTDHLEITNVANETVVLDTHTAKAYCLNALTTVVWGACTGENHIDSLLAHVKHSGFPDASEDHIRAAIEELLNAELLIEPAGCLEKNHAANRREALRRIGMGAAVSLPLITTIDIKPAMAQLSAGCGTGNCTNPCKSSPNEVRCSRPGNTNCRCEDESVCEATGGYACPGT